MNSSPQGLSFVRPPPIDTSGLVGALGPSSPPPRGTHTGPLTPPLGSEAHRNDSRDHDQDEKAKEKKQFLKALATEAAAVITMGTLTPTNLHVRGETSSTESSITGDGGGGGGGGDGVGVPNANSFRSRRGSEDGEKSLSLPFRQLIAHHAPSVADHNPGRLSSPRARAGAVRRGSGCDGMPLTGIRRRGSGSGVDVESALDAARRAKGPGFNGVRRGSTSGGGGIVAGVTGGAARLASGERRGSGGGSGGSGGIRWASGKPLTGVRRRGSGAGDEMASVVGDGVRWASNKPAISTRSNAVPSAGSYRGHADTERRSVSSSSASPRSRPSEEKEGQEDRRNGHNNQSFDSTYPRHSALRKNSSTATAKAVHTLQEREGTLSPTRGLARATARRLSALGAKAVGGIGFAGTNTSGHDTAPGATAGPLPPAASLVLTGSGSPGAKGEDPPPPPSREQRRRMSAAPLTEQQVLQGTAASRQPQASLMTETGGMTSPPPASGMARRRSSAAQQKLVGEFAAAQGIRDDVDFSLVGVAATAAASHSSYDNGRRAPPELAIRSRQSHVA